MAAEYTREQLKLCVAKMCLSIGWHTTMTTPIEILTDILCNYLQELGRLTVDYANGFGLYEPSVQHVVLAFKDFHLNLQDLTEFATNVDPPEPPAAVPQYPVPTEDHLNFLKPGSREVVTRPVHVHEHLPPMYPHLEEENLDEEPTITETVEEVCGVENVDSIFKRPAEVSQEVFKRPRILSDEEVGRPIREISSVMMTSSGFISPARVGRLPDSRTPEIALEPSETPLSPKEADCAKRSKTIRKPDKFKDNAGRELFKPYKDSQSRKHATIMKNIVRNKMKHHHHINTPAPSLPTKNYMVVNEPKIHTASHKKLNPENEIQTKFNRALAAARMKTEKFNTTITPIPSKSIPATIVKPEPLVDKLFTEPDKEKVNILRKISVKSDKSHRIKEEIKMESRESSPDLIIDESLSTSTSHNLPKDITIELVKAGLNIPAKKSPEKSEKIDKYYFDDYSPPGTPSTPRTPEMISQSPPLIKGEKQKHKSKHKKIQKYSSPSGIDLDVVDVEMERPKTPDSNIVTKLEKRKNPVVPPIPFPFFAPFSGPGLIPTPLTNSLFSHLSIPPLGIPSFGQPPYIPSLHPAMQVNFKPPVPTSSPILAPASVPVQSPSSILVSAAPLIKKDDYDMQPGSVDANVLPLSKLCDEVTSSTSNVERKNKEHKKDKLKKKNKKDKHKAEKRKLKEEKKEKSRNKREKKLKKRNKESENGNDNTSSVPKLTLKLPSKNKLNIKAILEHEEEDKGEEQPQTSTSKNIEYTSSRAMSPELAKFSALVTGQPKLKNHTVVSSSTREEEVVPQAGPSRRPGRPRIHPITPRPVAGRGRRRRDSREDSDGKKVWICPGCGVQDDGSPMIGCDDCDAWYHWVCVGIQVPPDDNEDWYCRHCIDKNRDSVKREKRKKHKSHEKKSRKH